MFEKAGKNAELKDTLVSDSPGSLGEKETTRHSTWARSCRIGQIARKLTLRLFLPSSSFLSF